MELESRVINLIFGWDMHNFILESRVDDKLEDVLNAIKDNKIENLNIEKSLMDSYTRGEITDTEICLKVAGFLREYGKFLIVIETPIPRSISRDDKGKTTWVSSGFGRSWVTVMVIDSIDIMREKIKSFEDRRFEEEYQKQLETIRRSD